MSPPPPNTRVPAGHCATADFFTVPASVPLCACTTVVTAAAAPPAVATPTTPVTPARTSAAAIPRNTRDLPRRVSLIRYPLWDSSEPRAGLTRTEEHRSRPGTVPEYAPRAGRTTWYLAGGHCLR